MFEDTKISTTSFFGVQKVRVVSNIHDSHSLENRSEQNISRPLRDSFILSYRSVCKYVYVNIGKWMDT